MSLLKKHVESVVGKADWSGKSLEYSAFFELKMFKKKELLMSAGERNFPLFFVSSGCLHMYFESEKGSKQTVQMAIENWWLTDVMAFVKNRSADFSIQAVTPVTVLCISKENYDRLLETYSDWNHYFRKVFEIAYGASLLRMKYQYAYTKEERYRYFIAQYPEFEQRVPQYLLASFLGVTPEYISELRAKIRS